MPEHSPLLQAVHLASRKLASGANFDSVLKEVLEICVEAVGASGGTIYLHDKATRRLIFQHVLPEEVAEKLPFKDIPDDFGVVGKVYHTRKTEISHFETKRDEEGAGQVERAVGVTVRTMITVPLMMEDEEPIGVVQLINKTDGVFDESDALVLDTVSAISTMAYLNSRLLDDQTRASQLLGMGRIAHDIKNLAFALQANVSFSDPAVNALRQYAGEKAGNDDELLMHVDLVDTMFDELNLSIERVARYSTLISDLSAGKELKPSMKCGKMSETIQLSAAYMESEGRANSIAIRYEIDEAAPATLHDEMYLFRIVQNLVSNAIKASSEVVPEGVRARALYDDEPAYETVVVRYQFADGHHVVEIEDHGPGMTRDIADKILSGSARSVWQKNTGSGWGTRIVLELAATHRADVSIDSEIGKGSIFRLRFPHAPCDG